MPCVSPSARWGASVHACVYVNARARARACVYIWVCVRVYVFVRIRIQGEQMDSLRRLTNSLRRSSKREAAVEQRPKRRGTTVTKHRGTDGYRRTRFCNTPLLHWEMACYAPLSFSPSPRKEWRKSRPCSIHAYTTAALASRTSSSPRLPNDNNGDLDDGYLLPLRNINESAVLPLLRSFYFLAYR